MSSKKTILVTNDDGITAPGIRFLVELMSHFGEVYVCAPDKPQSGMGHAITINSTLHVEEVDLQSKAVKEWSCSGTPADCVKIAIDKLLPNKPDLCVSGVNHGSNSSINILYSGTMSAAMEAGINGITAFGFSLCDFAYNAHFEASKPHLLTLIEELFQKNLPEGTILNINIPKTENIKGHQYCRQSKAVWEEDFMKREDPRGKDYYWLTGEFKLLESEPDTDEFALKNDLISVVPVQFDLTNYSLLEKLKN